jgi:hypothetical protein
MNKHHHNTNGIYYTCAMHPEISGVEGEKCPKCGMTLEAIAIEENERGEVIITSDPKKIEAGRPTDLSISIKKNSQNLRLDIAHEKKMHLMIMDENLTWFDHIHPEEQADGSYKVSETFPMSGKYLLYIDYKPIAGAGSVNRQEIVVSGAPSVEKVSSLMKLTSTVDGYQVKLLNGNDFKSERNQTLQFTVEKDGKPIQEQDIQNYLGARAHIVMIAKADKNFLHIHPMTDNRFSIYAETTIGKPGIYRIWVQFQIAGKIRTADFTVNVTKGEKAQDEPTHKHKH